MASEETTEPVSLSVPGELAAWLRRSADQRGVDVEQYASELLAAQRAVDSGVIEGAAALDDGSDGSSAPDERFEERLDDRLDDVLDGHFDEVLDEHLDDRLEEQRSEFVDLLEDVRSRVIQVKREADARVPADHDHADLAADVDDLDDAVESLAVDLEEQSSTVSTLETTVDRGFENYEAVLEHLVDATDDLADRVDRLARAALATRERVQNLAIAADERERVDELKRDAALEGLSSADCEACGRTVDVALLTEPRCPACAAELVDVEPERGFLGSATLVTGDPPALPVGDDSDVVGDLESVLEADRPHPGAVDWETTGDRS